jgi:hypothetical protein
VVWHSAVVALDRLLITRIATTVNTTTSSPAWFRSTRTSAAGAN